MCLQMLEVDPERQLLAGVAQLIIVPLSSSLRMVNINCGPDIQIHEVSHSLLLCVFWLMKSGADYSE